ncbi:alpha/beta-hydrolase [Myriangium duriaei CBS 260.36]|uniref:Alpha/beta-hydrolase n=1 Tax=Myriangium duriaei CBS 260.36 TaxID=1168546 RepID=A0A9P4MP41_9PEZI|nr:alpha/beta-hydrolase [Myriangium duriaei CBS 260.36]
MRFLFALISVLHLGYCFDQNPLLDFSNARTPVPPQLYAELEELSRIVDISYCVGTANTGISKPFNCLSRCSAFPSFELITTWNSGPLFTDSCGYIALSHAPAAQRIIIAFRGTYSIANTILDLATVPQEYLPYPASNNSNEDVPKCDDCSVHLGFYKSWIAAQGEILPQLRLLRATYPTYKLTLVGHSLGGAVAALAGLEFQNRGWKPTVTTFGEPKIGNEGLAKYFDQRFGLDVSSVSKAGHEKVYRRVTHRDDPVPLLPPTEWGFVPHAGEVFINKSSLPHDIGDLIMCNGDVDEACSAGDDASVVAARHAEARAGFEMPARFKLWQLLFAHRDYFWRLGVCLPQMRMPWEGIE